ncbi:hypothetical protein [Haloplanus natans]|uniref:hypothetical protein n=1 Tax=Haloplanus natans TaxID=376171 RepID=UPI00067769B9|nr:hypothetical protein [Haloplanus natans]
MTRKTRPISILAGPRRSAALAVALVALALLGAVAAAGTAVAQNEQPTVVVTDGTTAPDGTTTVGIVLTSAPNGLSGYYFDLTVGSAETARIESASYPDRFGLTSEPEISADGTAATLEAADMEDAIKPGATDVTLATVTIAGATPGEVTLSVDPRQFDADDGSAFSPATQSGTVTVSGGDGGTKTGGQSGNEAGSDGGTAGTSSTSDGEGTTGTDGGSGTGTGSGDEETSGSGSLPAVLSLVAIAVLAGIGLRRRR